MVLAHTMKAVAGMLGGEVPFERVEAFIESAALSDEERALLWLYAWVGAEPSVVALELGRTG